MKKILLMISITLLIFVVGCDIRTQETTATTTLSSQEDTTTREICSVYETPDIDIINPVVTTNSFSFEYEIVTAGCNGYITEISISSGTGNDPFESFEDFNQATYTINDLQSRSKYTLRIEYMYDYMAGSQLKYAKLYTIITESGIEVSAINPTSTADSISFEMLITDPDSVVYISSISVRTEDQWLDDIPQLGPYTMDGLDPNTEYIIEIEYNYPLRNDAYQLIEGTIKLRITTQPILD